MKKLPDKDPTATDVSQLNDWLEGLRNRRQEIAQLKKELNRLDEEYFDTLRLLIKRLAIAEGDLNRSDEEGHQLLWDREDLTSRRMKLSDQIEEKLDQYERYYGECLKWYSCCVIIDLQL